MKIIHIFAAAILSIPTMSGVPSREMPRQSQNFILPPVERLIDSQCDERYDNVALKCAYRVLYTPAPHIDGAMSDAVVNEYGCPPRSDVVEFMLTWMYMTDKIQVTLGSEAYPLLENPDVLVAYLASAIIYAFEAESPAYSDSMQYHSLMEAIVYYNDNQPALGDLAGMNMLTAFRDNGMLDTFLLYIAPKLKRPRQFDALVF